MKSLDIFCVEDNKSTNWSTTYYQILLKHAMAFCLLLTPKVILLNHFQIIFTPLLIASISLNSLKLYLYICTSTFLMFHLKRLNATLVWHSSSFCNTLLTSTVASNIYLIIKTQIFNPSMSETCILSYHGFYK